MKPGKPSVGESPEMDAGGSESNLLNLSQDSGDSDNNNERDKHVELKIVEHWEVNETDGGKNTNSSEIKTESESLTVDQSEGGNIVNNKDNENSPMNNGENGEQSIWENPSQDMTDGPLELSLNLGDDILSSGENVNIKSILDSADEKSPSNEDNCSNNDIVNGNVDSLLDTSSNLPINIPQILVEDVRDDSQSESDHVTLSTNQGGSDNHMEPCDDRGSQNVNNQSAVDAISQSVTSTQLDSSSNRSETSTQLDSSSNRSETSTQLDSNLSQSETSTQPNGNCHQSETSIQLESNQSETSTQLDSNSNQSETGILLQVDQSDTISESDQSEYFCDTDPEDESETANQPAYLGSSANHSKQLGLSRNQLGVTELAQLAPITPEGEDRIDRIVALLDRYKQHSAELEEAKSSLDATITAAAAHSDCDSDEETEAWQRVETSSNPGNDTSRLDRSWDDAEERNFPVSGFQQLNGEAEQRLAARRAARQEARDIRMREIERQQREAEEKEGKVPSTPKQSVQRTYSSRYGSSRQNSDDTEDTRTLKKELVELEDKYTKAMMDNAQLDNEKQMLRYEVDLLKDRLDDLAEEHRELQREHKDKCRDFDQKKRQNTDLTDEVAYLKQQLQQRDSLIEEYGLVFISDDTLADGEDSDRRKTATETSGTTALVTPAAADVLRKHGEGCLNDRLTSLETDRGDLQEEVKKLRQQLETEKERNALAEKYSTPSRAAAASNGPDISEIQMESQRIVNEYKFKLKKAQQDITTLEGNVIRLESQAKRYKQAADNSEKNEEALKLEKRKLQRELREVQISAEELTTSNQHLVARMEKMKSARNAILNKS